MTIEILFDNLQTLPNNPIIIPVDKSQKIVGNVKKILNETITNAIHRALKNADFKGKAGTFLRLYPDGFDHAVILVGIDSDEESFEVAYKDLGGRVAQYLKKLKCETATLFDGFYQNNESYALFLLGAALGSYSFTKYFTTAKTKKIDKLKSLTFSTYNVEALKTLYENEYKPIAESTYFARDIINEPGNVINPETLADQVSNLQNSGLEIEVLNEEDMKKLGMNSLLSVGNGSDKESRLVIMKWYGADNGNEPPVAFVGKGVTFDTGGVSIKPSANMGEMKFDMAGSAAVIGAMLTLAKRKAKANVVGIIGLAENMVSGNATRPGDIVTSMSGQTIEITNTDAEGRLVLADALWYCQDRFKPKFVVDFATLTGAILIALGSEYAGLFSNNDDLAEKIFSTSKLVGEKAWRLPLHENYNKLINSDFADVDNSGKERVAGSITAAQFLQRFIKEGTPWAHIDIAGVGWSTKNSGVSEKGPSAFGIMLVDRLVRDYFENKA